MAKLIILCGLPGSGKSSYAEKLLNIETTFGNVDVVIHSSDAIREELFGDAGSQENNALVFEIMHKRVKEDLRADKTVIYDATNITRKSRRGAINLATKDDIVECHIVWADPHVCIERDKQRNRRVGSEVIEKMLRRWQSPYKDEGFDSIRVVLNQDDFDHVRYISSMTANMHIPHDNPHHTLGVWEHCMQAYYNIEQLSTGKLGKETLELLKTAAYWHDIGKPWTKGYKTDKETGKIDRSVAHYYDHHCVGGYLSYGLFLGAPIGVGDSDDICFISWCISAHMDPFFNSHYYRDLDSHLKECIDILHAADLSAH